MPSNVSAIAIACFAVTILITLVITAWAAGRSKKTSDFYAAGGKITGLQNGLAISGDFMSATTLLGLTGFYFDSGWDTAIYYIAPSAGLCLMLLLLAAPMRRLGRFTLADVITHRLHSDSLRIFTGISTIVVSLFYLIAQMVGAGALISILFGFSFEVSVVVVGVLMAIYVAVGGMLAATWVQIIKASLLILAVLFLTFLVVNNGGGVGQLYARAAAASPLGTQLFQPGGFKNDLFSSLSLGLGLMFGFLGLPHLLIRFFTVPNEAQANRSLAVAVTIIAIVSAILLLIIGPGGVAFVKGVPEYYTPDGKLIGGGNMVTLHLAQALGGELLFGVIAAVAFATILAVVAGLTIASSTAASHDLYRTLRGGTLGEKEELWVFRVFAVALALGAILLAIAFQKENVAFLTALAFVVAASTNFPVLFLSLYWPRLTASGALIGGLFGLASSVTLIVLSPAVWVKVLGHAAPIFPADYPTLVTMPATFIVCWLVSMATQPKAARA